MPAGIDVFIVTRTHDWGSYGSGMEIDEVFTNRTDADHYVKTAADAEVRAASVYSYTYEVVTMVTR